jgi:endo-1,4-beta-mannosidase
VEGTYASERRIEFPTDPSLRNLILSVLWLKLYVVLGRLGNMSWCMSQAYAKEKTSPYISYPENLCWPKTGRDAICSAERTSYLQPNSTLMSTEVVLGG